MKVNLIVLVFGMLLMSCTSRNYHTVKVDNPEFRPNVEFSHYEDLNSPKFSHFIEKYQLDTLFHGEKDEFKRMLLIRHWIRSVISINDFSRHYSGDGYVEGILDAALKGEGFHCGHFMKVQNGLMNAYGYVTRTLGAGPGVKEGPDGHHGIDEIWSNEFQKWFLSDAKYDHHFEKNGIPLSALEVRNEYLKNKAADVVMVNGPGRVPCEFDSLYQTSKERFAQTYTWIEWHTNNNMCTVWPKYETMLTLYQDDYSENHTWFWDGKPHWAYSKPEFMRLVRDPGVIYWTPNTITSKAVVDGNQAHIDITSQTPNLAEYQVKKEPGGEWVKTDTAIDMKLKGERQELIFRAVNAAGVPGPEHRIVFERDK